MKLPSVKAMFSRSKARTKNEKYSPSQGLAKDRARLGYFRSRQGCINETIMDDNNHNENECSTEQKTRQRTI